MRGAVLAGTSDGIEDRPQRQAFESYAGSQGEFARRVAELAGDPHHAARLCECRAVETVRPLVAHADGAVRADALLGLARLARHSAPCARRVLRSERLLADILGRVPGETKYYKKSCINLIKNLGKHSSIESLITHTEVCGGIRAILSCIKKSDLPVKEVALQAIISFIRQDSKISRIVVNSGVLPQIVQCLDEKRQNLKLFALSTLDEMAKHSPTIARIIVNVPTLPRVIPFLSPDFTNIEVQGIALTLIKNIAMHSSFLTNKTIESNLLPEVLLLTAHPDESIRDKSVKVIHELVKHTTENSKMIVDADGISSLLSVISCSKEFPSTPAILSLGHVASMTPSLASAVIQSKALTHLATLLKSNTNDESTKAGTAWTLGMIGKHSAKHSKSIYACGALTNMMNIYMGTRVENKVRHKCISSIRLILNKCEDFATLEKFMRLSTTNFEIMACILEQISKILPKNSKNRRSFIRKGYLKMIQNIKPEIDSDLFKAIKAVNCCFPKDIIKMITGGYPESIMKTVDKYVPNSQCQLYSDQLKTKEKY